MSAHVAEERGNAGHCLSACVIHFSICFSIFLFIVLCPVDLRQMSLSLKVEKVRPGSECQMREGSTTMETVVVTSNTLAQLSFQDCFPGDVLITASRVIGEYILSHVFHHSFHCVTSHSKIPDIKC